MKISKRQAALVLGAYAAGMIGAALVGTPVQAAEPENCKTVTQNMVRPDSGVGGHEWATDTFVRNVKVCVEAPPVLAETKTLVAVTTATFKVVGHDEGTFVTKGIKSPKGNAMLPGVQGTFTGDFKATYTAPYDAANPTQWPFWAPSGSNADSTTPWVNKLWSQGHEGKLTSWGWTYTSCNEQWKNTADGNPGDITGLELKDVAKKCLLVTYKVLCDGKVDVTVDNKIAAGVKIRVNGVEKTLALGTNVYTGVTTVDGGWIRVKLGDKVIYEVKCIKPTTCPPATPTPTPTVTATVIPTTPAATVLPTSALYANCDAVRAAGKAPILSNQPGYALHLDSDKDGIGCEAVEGNAVGGNLAVTPGPSSGLMTILLTTGGAALLGGVALVAGMWWLRRRTLVPVEGDNGPDETAQFDRIV